MATWSFKKKGYCIELVIREAFFKDGSKLNRSIMKSVRISGTVHYRWPGPIVAMRQLPTEFYEDITLAGFRHIIDYFVTYNSSEVREIINPQAALTTPRAIRGVKVCCYVEIKLPIMSGGEAGFIVSLISGVVLIVEVAKPVFNAAKDTKVQLEAFGQIAVQLPLIIEILYNAKERV